MAKLSDAPVFYVYVHRRATDGTVFYVGKGKGKRLRAMTGRSRRWSACAAMHGVVAEIVRGELTEAEAFAYEVELILLYGRDTLCNLSDGGEGNAGKVISQAQREMISAFQKGRKDEPITVERKLAASAWRRKRVVCVETGAVFAGLNEAAKVLGLNRGKLSEVCNGRRPRTGGLTFRFCDA